MAHRRKVAPNFRPSDRRICRQKIGSNFKPAASFFSQWLNKNVKYKFSASGTTFLPYLSTYVQQLTDWLTDWLTLWGCKMNSHSFKRKRTKENKIFLTHWKPNHNWEAPKFKLETQSEHKITTHNEWHADNCDKKAIVIIIISGTLILRRATRRQQQFFRGSWTRRRRRDFCFLFEWFYSWKKKEVRRRQNHCSIRLLVKMNKQKLHSKLLALSRRVE